MNPYARSLLLLAITVPQTYGVIYDQVSQLPTYTYDYIVIGGAFPASYFQRREELICNCR